jgi:SAM-dependent methyltransferase
MILEYKYKFRQKLTPNQKQILRNIVGRLKRTIAVPLYCYGRFINTPINLAINKNKKDRKLEIGPGPHRIKGFETVNVVWNRHVDYVADASKRLPFPSNCFKLVYASHVLEHMPWYKLDDVVAEWARIIQQNGLIEIWVPNGLLIAKTFVEAEEGVDNKIKNDGWYKFNLEEDPCLWANGRIFSYGDGSGRKEDPNWHLTIFSPRFLERLLIKNGFVDVKLLDRSVVRGYDHGWINLGMRARKS